MARIKLNIRLDYLFACSFHFDKKREHLYGVQLEKHNGYLFYTGTSGHTMLSCRDYVNPPPEEAISIIIPLPVILTLRACRDKEMPELQEWIYDTEEKRVLGNNWITPFTPVDGNYPNWRRMLPEALTDRTIHPLSHVILEPLSKSIRSLDLGKDARFVFYAGVSHAELEEQSKEAYGFPLNGTYIAYLDPNIIGFCMSMRHGKNEFEIVGKALANFK